MTKIIILLSAQLFLANIAVAQQDVEIDGLVMDQSISRFGHQFYSQFSQLWRDVPNSTGINITVKETVLPRAGTRLEVLMNNKPVYATAMGRRGGSVDERVETAIFTVMDAMAKAQYQQSGSEDLAASGW
ncbi:curli production assembly protein CsgE [Pseudoalteromonas sp. McH1-7]|uniref:Curli production assembly/transport component CsgE n=1 Tax=Pseudoalteromonas peptidolytica F12-50-A1 TaxID=1315280 RepID=A0A8I0T5F5_9GAMM|nr:MULTISPECIES: CsgE family curli-type amyloid fiber assembly protein [Pseudoalteromonas]MBE0347342.1 curli production assembly/transport component CsgE [Pseudoalteromonas peptidolytica F12-50-A1]MDW7549459.1 CsgE family curli-type amyloid fiber assembly protein [Pseudoalteromonas peptidolytica]NLR13112.1 curli production assembly protein CsgE [Pseudoalteromonas peptidolytica]NUZ10643.1 curli production assembly protein CsgE [Pseudoalteromonas sp. McH1-7]RRS10717.1 curli production assembly p